MRPERYSLVTDIGGTNARFAPVADPAPTPIEPRILRCADYATIVDAASAYLEEFSLGKLYAVSAWLVRVTSSAGNKIRGGNLVKK